MTSSYKNLSLMSFMFFMGLILPQVLVWKIFLLYHRWSQIARWAKVYSTHFICFFYHLIDNFQGSLKEFTDFRTLSCTLFHLNPTTLLNQAVKKLKNNVCGWLVANIPGGALPAECIITQGLTPQSCRFRKQIVSVCRALLDFGMLIHINQIHGRIKYALQIASALIYREKCNFLAHQCVLWLQKNILRSQAIGRYVACEHGVRTRRGGWMTPCIRASGSGGLVDLTRQ